MTSLELFAKGLPCNTAAEKNKTAIFKVLKQRGLLEKNVFEIGSGTGQHGIYFCQQSPTLCWYPSEQRSNINRLTQWYQAAHNCGIDNIQEPMSFDVGVDPIPTLDFDMVYMANVWHILQQEERESLAMQLAENLCANHTVVIYGPFKQNGEFTTESNQIFHQSLVQQGYGGLIDMTDIEKWSNNKLKLSHVEAMPANNFLLFYQK